MAIITKVTTLHKLQKDLPRGGWLAASEHYGVDPDADYLNGPLKVGSARAVLLEQFEAWQAMGTPR